MIDYYVGALLAMIMVGGASLLAWILGFGNPPGYLFVLPWQVPACTCRVGTNRGMELHADDCAVTRLEPTP